MKTRTSLTSTDDSMYDDFEPSTEFSESHEAQFLRILLPGFTREQLRITFINFNRTLNISGQRQIDIENDKWVRFNQSYPVPQNCEEGKLQATFSHGVLTIAMPKKLLSPQTEAQQKGPFPSKKQEPKPNNKLPQDDIPQKAQDVPTAPRLDEPKPEKAREKTPKKFAPHHVGELEPRKGEENFPHKSAPPHVEDPKPVAQEKNSQKTKVEEPRPNKAQDKSEGPKLEKAHEPIPQVTTPSKLEEDEVPFRFRIPRGKEDLMPEVQDNERGSKAIGPQEPNKELRPEKRQDEETKPKPIITRPQRRPEKMFQEKEIRTRSNIKEKEKQSLLTKEDMVSTIEKGMRHVSASTSEVVTKLSEGKWKEEEKPMIVNMGAAILVIAALGVYVSYKLSSYGSS